MGLANSTVYPVAISLVNTGGNLGGFVSPMLAGALLDTFGNYGSVFAYFGIAALIGLIMILLIDEPVEKIPTGK